VATALAPGEESPAAVRLTGRSHRPPRARRGGLHRRRDVELAAGCGASGGMRSRQLSAREVTGRHRPDGEESPVAARLTGRGPRPPRS
jgi:hypothetical protein